MILHQRSGRWAEMLREIVMIWRMQVSWTFVLDIDEQRWPRAIFHVAGGMESSFPMTRYAI